MPTIRYRKNDVCAVVLGEIPNREAAYVKRKPNSQDKAVPVEWLGFICKAGTRFLPTSRLGKLLAKSVTNGDQFSSNWKDLRDDQYVVCTLLEIDSVLGYGVYAIVDRDGWPIVRDDNAPRLTIVKQEVKRQARSFR